MNELLKTSITIDKSFNQSLEHLDHTKIVINFHRRNHYINSLFYEKVMVVGAKVFGDVINENRKQLIANLINSIHLDLTQSSIRESKLSYDLSRFIQFIRWCDLNNLHSCLDNDIQCIDAFKSYVDYHWERVSARKYKAATTISVLRSIKRILRLIIHSDNQNSLPLLDYSYQRQISTIPPDDKTVGENIQLLLSLFNGICDFLLENKDYPYKLQVPSFLNVENDCFWLFPTRAWCQTDLSSNGTSNQSVNKGYNFSKGRVVTHEELIKRGELDKKDRDRIIKVAKQSIARFNKINHSYQKRDLAITAMSSFVFLFIANTGINPTQLLNITWHDEYSVEKESMDFKIIKHRANNKIVHFRISSNFLPVLKRYLELRKYFLESELSQFLIPSFNSLYSNHLDLNSISAKIKNLLGKIGYCSKLITPREWRNLKSEWLITNADPYVASKLLQNTEDTISKHYSSGSFTHQTEELGNYLEQLSKAKYITDKNYLQSTSVGGCSQPNTPIQLSENTLIKPNCKQPEGCLFCLNYLIHADKKDLHKILSCKYSIEHTQHLSKTIDQWHLIYDPVISRIDEIVSQIERINPILVEQVKTQVYIEQNLDSYWLHKLSMLYQIGDI